MTNIDAVKRELEEKGIFDKIVKALPWLAYERIDDLVVDAVRSRLENLLKLMVYESTSEAAST